MAESKRYCCNNLESSIKNIDLWRGLPGQPENQLGDQESNGETELLKYFENILQFISINNIDSYQDFQNKAGSEISSHTTKICSALQDELKVSGDWKIYPFAIHELIGKGKVAVDGRKIFIDGKLLPDYGYRLEQ